MSSSSIFANFATLVGVYDGTLYGGVTLDTSTNIGSGDLLLSANSNQYLLNTNSYTSPAATNGNGMSFTGWFYPLSVQATNAAVFDISSSTNTSCIYLTCTNTGYLTSSYNGSTLLSSTTFTVNSWNYFTMIVSCNGSLTNQYLYLNGNLAFTTVNTPFLGGVVYNSNMIGYGPGLNYFNGKIDDFRYYNRILTPPETNVLYQYNYKSSASTLTPFVSVSKDNSTVLGTASVVLDLVGTFSYLTIVRTVVTGTTGTNASYNVSSAALSPIASMSYSTWTDVSGSLNIGNTYMYSITPYILSNAGNTMTLNVTI